MASGTLITQDELIESILDRYRAQLARPLCEGYRNHVYRMLDFARVLAPAESNRDEKVAIMAAFHDLPFCLDGNLDYLDRAADLTDAWLDEQGRAARREEVRLMIVHHHKIRPYRGASAPLAVPPRL